MRSPSVATACVPAPSEPTRCSKTGSATRALSGWWSRSGASLHTQLHRSAQPRARSKGVAALARADHHRHSAHSNGGDDGHDRRPSRTIPCMLVTDHDHHGVSDRDGR
eukprot:7172482-Prymnesium_polylepis.1